MISHMTCRTNGGKIILRDLLIKGTHLALAGAFLYLPVAFIAGCSSPLPTPPAPTPEATGELSNIEWTLSGNLDAHDPVIIREGDTWMFSPPGSGLAGNAQ